MGNYLIIGASSGIGRQTALHLAELGHQVWGTFYRHPVADTVPNLSYHPLDVLAEVFDFGYLPESLDGLVYCPGSIVLRPYDRLRSADFIADYQLQVVGAVKVLQAVMPRLKHSDHAAIVFFSTVAVQTGLPYHSLVAASKGAIEGLTRSLAAELAPRIRVNAIAPSLTNTPLAESLLNNDQKREANALRHPLRRIGSPTDIAAAVTYLLTPDAGWVTGQVLHVDGGLGTLRV